MGRVILYEHGCPNCRVLKMKLDKSGIEYETINDLDVMKAKGFQTAPKLELEDGTIMDFKQAVDWLKGQ